MHEMFVGDIHAHMGNPAAHGAEEHQVAFLQTVVIKKPLCHAKLLNRRAYQIGTKHIGIKLLHKRRAINAFARGAAEAVWRAHPRVNKLVEVGIGKDLWRYLHHCGEAGA